MGVTTKLPIFFLLFSLFLSSALSLSHRRDPHQELQHCRRRCHTQESEPRRQIRCEERCERGSSRMEDEESHENPSRKRDTRQQLQECRRKCQTEEQGGRTQIRCEERCEQRYYPQTQGKPRRQQGECEDQRESARYETELHHEDPKRQLEECKRMCQMRRWATVMVHKCEDGCEADFEKQQRRQAPLRHEGRGTERKYEDCQRGCEREGRGQAQQWQCQRRCQEEFQRQRQGQGEGGRGRHHHGGSGSMRECRERCEEQGYGYDCERRCSRGDVNTTFASSLLAAFFA